MRGGCHSSGGGHGWVAVCLLLSCGCVNHFVGHPRTAPASVQTWNEDVVRGALRIHLEWAAPSGSGPQAAVLVHPEAGSTARDMRGVIWDLAAHGYVAVAADYQRLIGGRYRRTLFPWREPDDEVAAVAVVRQNPRVDTSRVGLVGFSQGGVFSLCIAARDPTVRAVVAYYPVTDFPSWLEDPDYGPARRFLFWFIKRHFRRQSGATSDEEFDRMLERASPLRRVRSITTPVLLVHGANDRTAPVGQSRRLAQALTAMNRDAALLEIEDAGHVFNFYDKRAAEARKAWQASLDFLGRHLRPRAELNGQRRR